ncbi:MAG TPA: dihydrofolate reductase [Allosphingosinicella sp.]|nr:dihydrofolate reductase [Allosphingosinicella sp.]
MVTLVVARADNGVIGRDGKLPWRLRSDMHHFRAVTLDKPMIMGRKTFESLPKLLDRRRHIVLTRSADWSADGAEVAHDRAAALALAGDVAEIAIVGGTAIFAMFLPDADRIELTEVHLDAEGDTFLPPFDNAAWTEIAREDHPAADGLPAFSFVTLTHR